MNFLHHNLLGQTVPPGKYPAAWSWAVLPRIMLGWTRYDEFLNRVLSQSMIQIYSKTSMQITSSTSYGQPR